MPQYPTSNGAHSPKTVNGGILHAQTFDFSRFDGKEDNTPKPARLDWRGVCATLERRSIRDAKDGPLFSGASYPPDATRGNKGVTFVSLATLDFDEGATLEDIEAGVSRLNSGDGCAAFLYSTHSHNPDEGALKYRLVLPLLEPIAGSDWARVWKRLSLHFDGAPDVSAKDAARMHYLPSCPKARQHFAVALELDGAPLDVATLPEVPKAPEVREMPALALDAAGGDRYAQSAFERVLGRLSMANKGGRNKALNQAALELGQFTGAGRLIRSECEGALLGVALRLGLCESEARSTMKSGLDAGELEPNRRGETFERFERNGHSQNGHAAPRSTLDGAIYSANSAGVNGGVNQGETERKEAARKFRRVGLQEIFERPTPDFLIYGLLPETGVALLSASQGSFKSFLALDMALCVATGKAFKGRKTKRGRVLYIAAEGAETAKDRARAWLGRFRHETPDGEDFPALFEQIEESVQVASASDLSALLALLEGETFALIILDTLTLCALGLEENSASEMGAFFAGCAALSRATGALVLVCHHNNKDGKYRGSTAMPAAVDAHLTLKRSERRADLRTVLGCEKMRGAAEFEPFTLQGHVFDLGELDSSGNPRTSLFFERGEDSPETETVASKSEEMRAAVLDVLRRDFPKGAKASEWQAKCESLGICKSSAFYDRRDELNKAGEVAPIRGLYIPKNRVTPPTPPTPSHSVAELPERYSANSANSVSRRDGRSGGVAERSGEEAAPEKTAERIEEAETKKRRGAILPLDEEREVIEL